MYCVLKNQERKLKSLRMQNDVGTGFFVFRQFNINIFMCTTVIMIIITGEANTIMCTFDKKKYSKSGIIKERRETWNQRCLKNCYFRPNRASNEMGKRSMHNLTVFAVFRRICHSFVGIWFLRNKDWCWRCITMCIFNYFFFRCLSK